MTTDRSADDEGAQNIAERLIDRVSDAAERVSEAGHAIVDGVQDRVEQLTSLLHREEPTQVGNRSQATFAPCGRSTMARRGWPGVTTVGCPCIASRTSAGSGASRGCPRSRH